MFADNGVPKYVQLVGFIEQAIASKDWKLGEKLPSVAKCCMHYRVSRDTVLLAYETLKKRGIVQSAVGKGYFVKSYQVETQRKVFVLFDELNAFKEELYWSLQQHLGKNVVVDVFFHHFNPKVFRALIEEANGNYSDYVIMPSNLIGIETSIQKLPKEEVYLLDQSRPEWQDYASVHQDFAIDMYAALTKVQVKLKKYEQLVLIFPEEKEPLGMVDGFVKFAETTKIPYQVIPNFSEDLLQVHSVFIVPRDRDLVQIVETSHTNHLVLSKDYGIISYNDTPLKKIVEKGITTITTDFQLMGKTMAQMILNKKRVQVHNPSKIILRNSL